MAYFLNGELMIRDSDISRNCPSGVSRSMMRFDGYHPDSIPFPSYQGGAPGAGGYAGYGAPKSCYNCGYVLSLSLFRSSADVPSLTLESLHRLIVVSVTWPPCAHPLGPVPQVVGLPSLASTASSQVTGLLSAREYILILAPSSVSELVYPFPKQQRKGRAPSYGLLQLQPGRSELNGFDGRLNLLLMSSFTFQHASRDCPYVS